MNTFDILRGLGQPNAWEPAFWQPQRLAAALDADDPRVEVEAGGLQGNDLTPTGVLAHASEASSSCGCCLW